MYGFVKGAVLGQNRQNAEKILHAPGRFMLAGKVVKKPRKALTIRVLACILNQYHKNGIERPKGILPKCEKPKLCEKRREQQELQEEEPNDFDLGNYIEQSEQENDELAETLLNDTPEMEDVNILEFDDSVTPEEKPEESPEEENTEEQEEAEEPAEQLVDNDIPVESMLDYPDDALSLTDELVDEKDDTNEEPADDEETETKEEEQPEQENQEEEPQYPVFENTAQRPPEQSHQLA